MEYIQIEQIKAFASKNNHNKGYIEKMKGEVEGYFDTFSDSPDKTSRWGHHYFCKKDGGLLIYDDQKPHEHVCSICSTPYQNDLLDGVWVYMYRNQGVVNAWKSALLYKITGEARYLKYLLDYTTYYAENYSDFKLHNKEGNEFDTLDEMEWGCARIMPQSLNESIFIIRLVNALELVKGDLKDSFIASVEEKFFNPAFEMFKPQVNKIHNISCWLNSAIGVMGLFLDNNEMKNFVFKEEYNINNQLIKGVTDDGFWYEGSIHYNFFTLEGIVNLLLFSKLYNYDFPVGEEVIEKMLTQAYKYAFDSHQLPNPNDGWPNVNLKSYSYIYAVGVKIFGDNSMVGEIFNNIVNKAVGRNEFPLSKPYYLNNDLSLEELLFIPNQRDMKFEEVASPSINFPKSYCGTIKNDRFNIFYKYGHNGPSHAHPDKMTIEVTVDDKSLSRDLSNSGYGNALCNEWHRVSASHNTVVLDGKCHTSVAGGDYVSGSDTSFDVVSKDVYKDVDYRRCIELKNNGFSDVFTVTSEKVQVADYFFHVEGQLISELELVEGNLGFKENGYQHLKDVKKYSLDGDTICLKWQVDGTMIHSKINIKGKTLFIAKSPDNPVTDYRTTLILRSEENNPVFEIEWTL